ncbi:MAG: DUF1080 domain-containing protein [Verrucomicrobiota bacterium]
MKPITPLSLLTLSFLTACAQAPQTPNTLSSAEKSEGWQHLFDGQSLSGWRGYNQIELHNAWTAQDGALALSAKTADRPQVNIITEEKFDDFDFRFEWKITHGTNSGVMFHIGEGPKKPYHTGPEYQIIDNHGYRDKNGNPVGVKHHTATLYGIEEPASDETKPIGEWNQSRILVQGNKVEHWLNGVIIAKYEMHSADWKAKVAQTKFATWEHFAATGQGHLGLQDHNHPVWFRNLKIKRL